MIIQPNVWTSRLVARGDFTLQEAHLIAEVIQGLEAELPPEDYFIAGQALCGGGRSVAAGGAGLRSYIHLRNRSTRSLDPTLIIVDDVILSALTAAQFSRAYDDSAPGAGSTGTGDWSYRDLQWVENRTGAPSLFTAARGGVIEFNNTTNLAGIGAATDNSSFPVAASTCFHLSHAPGVPVAVLCPGTALGFLPTSDNVAIGAYFIGRELYLRSR